MSETWRLRRAVELLLPGGRGSCRGFSWLSRSFALPSIAGSAGASPSHRLQAQQELLPPIDRSVALRSAELLKSFLLIFSGSECQFFSNLQIHELAKCLAIRSQVSQVVRHG